MELHRGLAYYCCCLLALYKMLPAAAGDYPLGRQLFLRGFMPPLAASYRPELYRWSYVRMRNGEDVVWVSYFDFRPAHAQAGPTFLALFYKLEAMEYRGQRIRLSAEIGGIGIDNREGASAGLFVRVEAADGRVIAFDNMSARRFEHKSLVHQPPQPCEVVLDVPAVPASDLDVCPDAASIPVIIAAGFFVVGRTTPLQFNVQNVVLKAVSPEVPVTQEPSNLWQNPCLDNLGQGFYLRQNPFFIDDGY